MSLIAPGAHQVADAVDARAQSRFVPAMRWRALALALALAACATPPPAPAANAHAVVAAERAFAARAGAIGWVGAFREYAAPDASLGQPGYPNAHETLAQTPDQGNTLFWWPAFAGMARSGDFGFTTGPFSIDATRTPQAHYFTVWRRQPDGAWKWIYDGGVGPIAEPDLIAPDAANVPALARAARAAGSAEAARVQVRALEEGGDLSTRFADEVQMFRTRQARVIGPGAATPAGVAYTVSRLEASSAGDLVLVLGQARWPGEAGEISGLYARIWQLRAEGWRIVYDQLVPPPPAPAG